MSQSLPKAGMRLYRVKGKVWIVRNDVVDGKQVRSVAPQFNSDFLQAVGVVGTELGNNAFFVLKGLTGLNGGIVEDLFAGAYHGFPLTIFPSTYKIISMLDNVSEEVLAKVVYQSALHHDRLADDFDCSNIVTLVRWINENSPSDAL